MQNKPMLPHSIKSEWPWHTQLVQQAEQNVQQRRWPRITLVTPSYQQGAYIEETIRSVLLQGYPNLEYLIIDGGSTDKTVEVIRQYEPWLTYWVSEPDGGQTQAINKGWSRSTGELLAWLNSDDLLAPGALFAVADAYCKQPNSVIAGSVINFQTTPAHPIATIQQTGLTWQNLIKFWEGQTTWHQPGIFVPRTTWLAAGPLDEQFYYCMDRDWLVRVLRQSTVTYLDATLAYFRVHPAAKTVLKTDDRFLIEKVAIVEKYAHWLPSADQPSLIHFWLHMAGRFFYQGELKRAIHCIQRALSINATLTFIDLSRYTWRLPYLLRSG